MTEPRELREQYEKEMLFSPDWIGGEPKDHYKHWLESRLSEMERESERWHSEMLDMSRQLSESQKESQEWQDALHACEAEVERLKGEQENG